MPNFLKRFLRYLTSGLFEAEIEKAEKFDNVCKLTKNSPFQAIEQLDSIMLCFKFKPQTDDSEKNPFAGLFKEVNAMYNDRLQVISELHAAKQELLNIGFKHVDEITELSNRLNTQLETAKQHLAVANGKVIETEAQVNLLKTQLQDAIARERQLIFQMLHHYSKFKLESTEGVLKRYAKLHPDWIKIDEKPNQTENETSTGNN